MAINTKSIKRIPIPKHIENRLILSMELEKYYEVLNNALTSIIGEKRWILIKNKGYYLIPEDKVILPNPKLIRIRTDSYVNLKDYNWKPMSEQFAQKWFVDNSDNNPMVKDNMITYVDAQGYSRNARYVYCDDDRHMKIGSRMFSGYIDSIKIPVCEYDISEEELLVLLIKNEWDVFEDENISKLFFLFTRLNHYGLLTQSGRKYTVSIDSEDEYELIWNEMSRIGCDFNIDKSDEKKKILEDDYSLDESILSYIKKRLLDCDKVRVNMDSYPEHILQDPQSGHWELWDDGNYDLIVNSPTTFVARNPVYDALDNKSGVIGIDFGTKSTVVTYKQSTADILPMRIGSGQFSRAVSKSDYENPTVMELRNIKKFMEEYSNYEGRPNTCWEDLLISHEAAEQLKSEQSKGDTFATFFSELKQWASDKNRQVRLRDLQGVEVNIPSYISLGEEDFDPIEIYTYYLGLFINNMEHGIYLRYRLSFPATVEKTVRDKILNSFTKGIKKSLPVQVLNDDACMRIFKVEQGASEPAAYAITALYGYNFDPEEDEKFYYGIFDFGGGTTDFDFGVWSSEEDEPENYDYQISHFGQGGDPYLGGENLLDILAYNVFIKNYDDLLSKKIVFIKPFGEKEIAGKDYLVRQDSQYAQFNQKRLKEKLRGVWEGDEDIRTEVRSGTIMLPLFTMDGESESNCPLEVDLSELDMLLEARIDKGVEQFFEAFKNCFLDGDNIKYIYDVNNGFNIFLAGNSSKSPMVYKAFKKYINLTEKPEWFNVYPPLGTNLSNEILSGNLEPNIDSIQNIISYKHNNQEIDENYENIMIVDEDKTQINQKEIENEFDISILTKPTGKTGVAFGLLNNRVRVVQNETEEIGFRYYIGQNRKQKFYCAINKDNQSYNVWCKFCKASKEEFDIWFTRSAAAPSNKLPINQIGIHSELGVVEEPSTDKNVFIRLISPTDIEYVVATEDEIMNFSYDESSIERVTLQEKQ